MFLFIFPFWRETTSHARRVSIDDWFLSTVCFHFGHNSLAVVLAFCTSPCGRTRGSNLSCTSAHICSSLVRIMLQWKPWYNVHGQEFLEQKFTSVGYLQRGNVVRRRTIMAPANQQISGISHRSRQLLRTGYPLLLFTWHIGTSINERWKIFHCFIRETIAFSWENFSLLH